MTAALVPVLATRAIPASAVSVTVRVNSEFGISAVASVEHQRLPEQHVGISDRPLNQRAITMLADAVAAAISNFKR